MIIADRVPKCEHCGNRLIGSALYSVCQNCNTGYYDSEDDKEIADEDEDYDYKDNDDYDGKEYEEFEGYL